MIVPQCSPAAALANEAGYLEPSYPRRGPGGSVGHPAKLSATNRHDSKLDVSIPPRRYDLVAEILV